MCADHTATIVVTRVLSVVINHQQRCESQEGLGEAGPINGRYLLGWSRPIPSCRTFLDRIQNVLGSLCSDGTENHLNW